MKISVFIWSDVIFGRTGVGLNWYLRVCVYAEILVKVGARKSRAQIASLAGFRGDRLTNSFKEGSPPWLMSY